MSFFCPHEVQFYFFWQETRANSNTGKITQEHLRCLASQRDGFLNHPAGKAVGWSQKGGLSKMVWKAGHEFFQCLENHVAVGSAGFRILENPQRRRSLRLHFFCGRAVGNLCVSWQMFS